MAEAEEATPKGGAVGGVYSSHLRPKGDTGEEARPDLFPRVHWISVAEGTREPGEIEDKAAQYVESRHVLKINADFRVFTDMVDHWIGLYADEGMHALRDTVRDSVHGWYEQMLTETIIGLQALRGNREWPVDKLQCAWSEEALTATVMQRYHAYNAIKRELGTKVASLKR